MTDDIKASKEGRDAMARVVMERFWRAKDYRQQHIVHQGKSFEALLRRSVHQYRREYTAEDSASMQAAFGFCPTRYYPLVQQKVDAAVAWLNDLTINNLDGLITVSPTPVPELDEQSMARIHQRVRDMLLQRMQESGVADPMLLVGRNGEVDDRIQNYLQEQVKDLKQVEQALVVSQATGAATDIQTKIRDMCVEGGMRQGYQAALFDMMLTGAGVMKFPDFRRTSSLKHGRNGKVSVEWETRPWFRHVEIQQFYPICDAPDTLTNTGNTEYTYITKADLIGLVDIDGYYDDVIADIIDEFAYRGRSWVDAEIKDDGFWHLDQTIPLMIHEGFFSGSELREQGITGLADRDYVSARVEVCGGRTIRCSLLKMPGGFERTYFLMPFAKIGPSILDCIGMGPKLWDTEQRINRFLHMFEHNADWATRPPIMRNSDVFDDPDALIVPGGQYEVEERFGASAAMPEPARAINTVSAQYHLLLTQVNALIRMADDECGLPAYAYSSQNYGQASLGEFSQRMTNALRSIKQVALNQDIYFFEPGFTCMYNYVMEHYPELAAGADIKAMVRGMTGLLKQDTQMARLQQAIPAVLSDQSGLVSTQAKEYAARQFLELAGFPVDALGSNGQTRAVYVTNGGMVSGIRQAWWHAPLQLDLPFQNIGAYQRVLDALAAEGLASISPYSPIFTIDKQVTISAMGMGADDNITFERVEIDSAAMPRICGCCIIDSKAVSIIGAQPLVCGACDTGDADYAPQPVTLSRLNPVIVLDHPQRAALRAVYHGELSTGEVFVTAKETSTNTWSLSPSELGCTPHSKWTPTGEYRCTEDTYYEKEVNDCADFRWTDIGPITWTDTGTTRCVNHVVQSQRVNQCGTSQWFDTDTSCGYVPTLDLGCGALAYRPTDDRDPAATVELTNCEGDVIGYIYPEPIKELNMAAFITCSDIGSALIQWIDNASDEDKAKLCEVLDCGIHTVEDSGLTGNGSSKDPLGQDTSKLQRALISDIVKHVIAGGMVAGFFGVILASLLGFVDIKDPAVTAFVGTALGYVAGEIKKVLDYYFPHKRDEVSSKEAPKGGYTDNADDPGNWTGHAAGSGVLKGTKYGISAASYPYMDIKNLTIEQAADLYREDYWLKPNFDKLPAALGFQVFDTGVNSGPARATKILQRVVGVQEDGILGPRTLAMIAKNNLADTIYAFIDARKAFLKSLPTYPVFGKGWMARVDADSRPRRVTHTLPEKAPVLGGPIKAAKPPAAVARKKRPCSACGKGRSW
ncbi:glycosyl hydrolase 108 [Lasius niger]|uniref:Glycosyl hydrolase 108 n=1 Tax=Lasius niger TaxID=67767 RepID=A0A0J7L3B0_LASNI|nr:glycosyl hydrolase 108 [Lasius niger]